MIMINDNDYDKVYGEEVYVEKDHRPFSSLDGFAFLAWHIPVCAKGELPTLEFVENVCEITLRWMPTQMGQQAEE